MPEENKETKKYTEQDLKISVLCAALANREENSEGYDQYKINLETVLGEEKITAIKPIYKKGSEEIRIGYVVETNKQAIVAFRGTRFSRMSEVRNDLNNNTSTLNLDGEEYKVHEGFKTEYELCKDSLQKNIKDIDKPIIFTGHSLGGALATFAALDHHKDKNIKNVITYGAPKSFHADSVIKYNKALGEKTLRIEQKFDPATKYPFSKVFKAVGQKISMHAGSFYHISPTNVHKGNMYRKLVNKIKQENLDSLNGSEQESRSIESYISTVMEYCKEKVKNIIVRPQNTPKKADNGQNTAILR